MKTILKMPVLFTCFIQFIYANVWSKSIITNLFFALVIVISEFCFLVVEVKFRINWEQDKNIIRLGFLCVKLIVTYRGKLQFSTRIY